MLNLLKAGQIIRTIADGSVVQIDGIYLSPAYAGWSHGDYSLTEAPPPEPQPEPELTPEELRAVMPRKSMVEFRASLRSIKVIPREGEAELDGIYEEGILAKIALIADRALQAEARDYFLYAEYIERTNPWVEILGAMFGLSPAQIDTEWMR